MIKELVERFDAAREQLRAKFSQAHPGGYEDIVKAVIEAVSSKSTYGDPDPERIHCIDDGEYQGTLLFLIAANTYQPSLYWFVYVGYGSCSGCDTFAAIREANWSGGPTEEQVNDYMTLALHIVQGLKVLGDGNDSV